MHAHEVIKEIPFFSTLSEKNLAEISEQLKYVKYSPSTIVCQIDDPGDQMFIVISGKVDVCIHDIDGDKTPVATLKAGDFFGEMALMTGEPRTATVRTTEESEMLILHKNEFDKIVERFPLIQMQISTIMSKRLRKNLSKAMEMSKNAASKKIVQKSASGTLSTDKAIPDIMGFCDQKALTGDIQIVNGNKKAIISYNGGQIMYVHCGLKKDDEALDEILAWEHGTFSIVPREISFKELIGEEKLSDNLAIVVSNSAVVRRVLEKKLIEKKLTVKSASNINSALETLSLGTPKYVVSDMKFEDGNASTLVQKFLDKGVDAKYILLSDGRLSSDLETIFNNQSNVFATENHDVASILRLID
jgi:CRP-like cAMP-binding protein